MRSENIRTGWGWAPREVARRFKRWARMGMTAGGPELEESVDRPSVVPTEEVWERKVPGTSTASATRARYRRRRLGEPASHRADEKWEYR